MAEYDLFVKLRKKTHFQLSGEERIEYYHHAKSVVKTSLLCENLPTSYKTTSILDLYLLKMFQNKTAIGHPVFLIPGDMNDAVKK